MHVEELLVFVLAFLVFAVPALAVTARLALKPIVEAVVRLREAFTPPAAAAQTEQRLLRLEQEVRGLRAELRRLDEGQRFEGLLATPPETAAAAPATRQPL